jgi:hypothetical protein
MKPAGRGSVRRLYQQCAKTLRAGAMARERAAEPSYPTSGGIRRERLVVPIQGNVAMDHPPMSHRGRYWHLDTRTIAVSPIERQA